MIRLSRPRPRPFPGCRLRLVAAVAGGLACAGLAASAAPSPTPAPAHDPTLAPSAQPILKSDPDASPGPAAGAAETAAPTPSGTPPPAAESVAAPAPAPTPRATPGPTGNTKRGGAKRAAGNKSAPPAAPAVQSATAPERNAPVYAEADCVALAIRQNPDILAAAKRVDATAAQITTAKGPLFPTLSAQGFYQRLEQDIANGGAITTTVNARGQTVVTAADYNRPTDYYGDVRVTQNLYSGGGVRNRIAAAKLQKDAESCNLENQLDITTLAVRAAFYNTLYAEANIGVRQQAVDLLAAQVKDQQDRLAAGSVSQLNVNRAQVQLANERPALLDAQAALGTAYATLAQALGASYTSGSLRAPFRVRGELVVRPVTMTLEECRARAQAARPDIRARVLTIEALKHLAMAEKAATRPQVTAFAAYDIYSEPDIRTVDDYYSGYTLGINASWTIFDGFATRGRVRGVQAQIGEAEAQLTSTRKQVENDVYTAYNDLRSAESSLRPLSDNIRLAGESLTLTTRNFDAGVITSQLDVLQARVDLTRSRSSELAGRLAYNTALARLERAMSLGRPGQVSDTAMLGRTAK